MNRNRVLCQGRNHSLLIFRLKRAERRAIAAELLVCFSLGKENIKLVQYCGANEAYMNRSFTVALPKGMSFLRMEF